jgi:hypothetical protein
MKKFIQRSRRQGKTEEVKAEVKAAIERGEQIYTTDAPETAPRPMPTSNQTAGE